MVFPLASDAPSSGRNPTSAPDAAPTRKRTREAGEGPQNPALPFGLQLRSGRTLEPPAEKRRKALPPTGLDDLTTDLWAQIARTLGRKDLKAFSTVNRKARAAALRSIESIRVGRPTLSPEGEKWQLQAMVEGRYENLREVEFHDRTNSDENCIDSGQLPKSVKKVVFGCSSSPRIKKKHLDLLPASLESLTLDSIFLWRPETSESWPPLTRLKTFSANKFPLPSAWMRGLIQNQSLTAVQLCRADLPANCMNGLGGLRHLRLLSITRGRLKDKELRSFVENLSSPFLTSLDVSNNRLGPLGAWHASKISSLTSLDMGQNSIGDRGLGYLQACSFLVELSVYKADISSQGVANFFAAHHTLKKANFSFNPIDDAVATALSLAGLEELGLAGTEIKMAGARTLVESPSLRKLNLRGIKMSDRTVRNLERLRPASLSLQLDAKETAD